MIPGNLISTLLAQVVSGVVSLRDSLFNYVSLLLSNDGITVTSVGTNNNTFVDSTANAVALTRTGTPTQGTFSPFDNSGWSGYFNGTTDYLSAPASATLAFGTGDFTVEAWVFFNSVTGTYVPIFQSAAIGTGTSDIWFLALTGGTLRFMTHSSGSYNVSTTWAPSVGKWYHLAVTRTSGTTQIYIDGAVVTVSGAASGSGYTLAQNGFTVGAITTPYYFSGYISNARIIKGTAVYSGAFTPSTAPLTAVTNTVLLALQDSRFKDNSTNNFALTAAGTPAIQAFSPFASTVYSAATNSGSMYFNGTTDQLSAVALPLGAQGFTVEMWIYPTQVAANATLFWSSLGVAIYQDTTKITGMQATLPIATSATGVIAANRWYHIALVRITGVWTIYVNGISVATGTASTNYVDTTFIIGGKGSTYFQGYISNLRAIAGTSLYSANFTPPNAPLTAVAGTTFLLNGTNAGIIDSTGKNVITTVGTTKVQTSVVKYGTGASQFNGTTDYLTIPSSSLFNLSNGDWTIEYWLNHTANSAYQTNFFIGASASCNLAVGIDNTLHPYVQGSAGQSNSATAITAGVWNHLAFVKSGSTITCYLNGTSIITASAITVGSTTTIVALGYFPGVGQYTSGYIDDLRVTKGVARYTANFTAPTAALPTSSATDSYFNYNALLLQGDAQTLATNVAKNNTFIDSSTNALTITSAGTTTQGTFSPFDNSGWSANLSSSQYITAPANTAYDIVGGDFTVECWINFTAYNAAAGTANQLITNFVSTGGWIISINGINTVSGLAFTGYTGGVGTTVTASGLSPTLMPLGIWHHVAVVKSGASLYFYLNGTNYGGAITAMSAAAGSTLAIGVYQQNLTYAGNPNWNLSNLRIVKGTALYTGNFSVPTAPLTAISGTSLLTFQDNRFKDNSSAAALTLVGTPSIQAKSPFPPSASYTPTVHGGSMYFNGTTDYLSTPAFTLTSTFTTECWIYPTTLTVLQSVVGKRSSTLSYGAFNLYFNSAAALNLLMSVSNTTWDINVASSVPCKVNAWNHIALVKTGTAVVLYINGVAGITTAISSVLDAAIGFGIGAGATGGGQLFNGYISDFRHVNGSAVYTTAFTPPTTPLTPITNTSLLLNGTNAAIADASGHTDVVLVGSATVNSFSKFGNGSLKLNGTTDYISIPASVNYSMGTGNFTIECWVYPLAYGGSVVGPSLFQANSLSTTGYSFNLGETQARFRFTSNGTGTWADNLVVTGPALNTWSHCAVVRNGTSLTIYINGVQAGTTTIAAGFTLAGATTVATVGYFSDGSTTRYLNGYIDDLRVTKGQARYLGNFTPPTVAFPTY